MARVTRVKKARVSKYTRLCDYPGCGHPIEPGDGMKYISPRLPGSPGSVTRYRCASHPDWNVWEYSTSLSARIAKLKYDGNDKILQADENTIEDLPTDLGWSIRGIAYEKSDSAQNVESSFGHPTRLSESLKQQADALEDWAYNIECVDVLEGKPDEEDRDEEAIEEWLENLRNGLRDALERSPL